MGKNVILQERMGDNRISQEITGFHGRGTVIHERERERMGFHRRERDFTVEHSIRYHGKEQDFTGENGREQDFTGEKWILWE